MNKPHRFSIYCLWGGFVKIKWHWLGLSVAVPLCVGALATFLTYTRTETFENFKKPFLFPPEWVFLLARIIIFILMGIACYLIIISPKTEERKTALQFYGLQLIFNFFWHIIFFNLKIYSFAFVWLTALLILIFSTLVAFYRISKNASRLLIPYFLWVVYAGYINISFAFLN